MPRRWILGICALSAGVGSLPLTASADGGYFPRSTASVAATTDQRAALVYEANRTTLILSTGYAGDAAAFSWIVPTAQLLTADDVDTLEVDPFAWLHEETAPRLVSFRHGCGVTGCAADGGADTGSASGITIFDSFRVDDFALTVLSATDATDLATWLTANGYVVPAGGAAVLTDYIDRGFYFVAVQVDGARPDPTEHGGEATGEENPGPGPGPALVPGDARPLRMRFEGRMTTFPLLISSLSTREEADVLIYTFAGNRFDVANFPTVDVRFEEAFEGQDFDRWYDERLRALLAEAGGNAFAVEYADTISAWTVSSLVELETDPWLTDEETWFATRLRARLSPEAMTRDVELVERSGANAREALRVRVLNNGTPLTTAALFPWDLALVIAVGAIVTRRRTGRGSRS